MHTKPIAKIGFTFAFRVNKTRQEELLRDDRDVKLFYEAASNSSSDQVLLASTIEQSSALELDHAELNLHDSHVCGKLAS